MHTGFTINPLFAISSITNFAVFFLILSFFKFVVRVYAELVYRIYPFQEGYNGSHIPLGWIKIILFIPCLGYSDLGRNLSLPTEQKWHTFSTLVNAKSSKSSLGSGCDLMLETIPNPLLYSSNWFREL